MASGSSWKHNKQAESAVLGCAIIEPTTLSDIIAEVDGEDFHQKENVEVFRAIKSLHSRGIPPDFLTVRDELASSGKLVLAGGASYVSSLTDDVPALDRGVTYARIVRERAIARRYVETLESGADEIKNGRAEVHTVAGRVLQASLDSVKHGDTSGKAVLTSIVDELEDIQSGKADGFLSVGFETLDKYAPSPCDLFVIAARPSVGKTMVSINFGEAIAARGQPFLLCSAEMSAKAIMRRRIALGSGVPTDKMRRKNGMSDEDWSRVTRTMGVLDRSPFFIDDKSQVASQVLASIRKHHAKHGIVAAGVDYLQLLMPSKDYGNTNDNVGMICKQMKATAKELGIVIFLLSQLNRASEIGNREPTLTDLRDSGTIEQAADIVLFLCGSGNNNEMKFICGKNREGQTGSTMMGVNKTIGRIF